MGIKTQMSGKEIDRSLKEINECQTADNNGLVLYIRDGKIAADAYENLFDIVELEVVT